MANTKSAIKRARQTKVRTDHNKSVINRVRTLRKKLSTVVATGDAAASQEAYNDFSSAVDKAAKRNIIPANTASNYKQKASKTLKSLGA